MTEKTTNLNITKGALAGLMGILTSPKWYGGKINYMVAAGEFMENHIEFTLVEMEEADENLTLVVPISHFNALQACVLFHSKESMLQVTKHTLCLLRQLDIKE